MPRRIAPLTDTKVKTVKPTEKPLKLFDGWGLYLLVTPTGGKLWNLKYRIDGKEKKLSANRVMPPNIRCRVTLQCPLTITFLAPKSSFFRLFARSALDHAKRPGTCSEAVKF